MDNPTINIDASKVTSEIFAWLTLIASYQAMTLHVAQGNVLDEKARIEIQIRVVEEWRKIYKGYLAPASEV